MYEETDLSQKYRPTTFSEMALPKSLRKILEPFATKQKDMNLMLSGTPGRGKTTFAKIINPECTIFINCSEKQAPKEINRIMRNCSAPTLSGKRVIVFDEADYLPKETQAELRAGVETHSKVNTFIMTVNDPSKIISPLHSRFTQINFDREVSEQYIDEIQCRVLSILKTECYPDTEPRDVRK